MNQYCNTNLKDEISLRKEECKILNFWRGNFDILAMVEIKILLKSGPKITFVKVLIWEKNWNLGVKYNFWKFYKYMVDLGVKESWKLGHSEIDCGLEASAGLFLQKLWFFEGGV